MKYPIALLVMVSFWLQPVGADQQLESLKNISAAGAPFLTLQMLEQAQPGIDQDLYAWILWEQERYQILTRWEQWNDLLLRIESLPQDLPEPFLQLAATFQVTAYLELGQTRTARDLLRERLWQPEAGASDQYRDWRQLMIRVYLAEQRIDDARIAMLRFQQDFADGDKDWTLLRGRVLIQAGRYDQAIEILSGRLDWQSLSLKLLAEYRNQQHSPREMWDLARKRIEIIKDDPEQTATYWAIAAIAGDRLGRQQEVVALESRLGIDAENVDKLYHSSGEQLWQSYAGHARQIGNRTELLFGDDQSWYRLALDSLTRSAVDARSLLAFLMLESPQKDMVNRAGEAFLKSLDLDSAQHQHLLEQLFNHSEQFNDAARIPVAVRFQLVDQALKRADIAGATRLMSGLTEVPENTSRFDWLLRRARVLILGGRYQQGNEVLDELLANYREPDDKQTDRILQVLFDLQTIGRDEDAVGYFRQLMNRPIEPQQKREILFWMGDSFAAMEQFNRAALLYLQSAMFIGVEAMDPWAQTARYKAAESLQKAGLVDDARRIYESLLKVTREPARRAVLTHSIQQLWLVQNALE